MLCFKILAGAANGGNNAGARNSQGSVDDADREANDAAGHRMCKKLFSTIDYPL